jgi:membrane protease YdiL (CAAX protease family)
MNIRQTIQRYPLVTYFGLAYALAWGGMLVLVGPKVFGGVTLQTSDIVLIFLAMCAGPSVTGILLTAIVSGKTGLRHLLSRMGRWKVGALWYAVALFTAPVLILAVLLTLTTFVSPVFAPSLSIAGLAVGLIAGFFEEIGWTGFALPKMQSKSSALAAGLLLGVLWGGWHFLAGLLGGQTLPVFLLFAVALVAYRVLMTWVYTQTGSVLLAQLMHAFYTGSLFVLTYSLPAEKTLLFNGAFAVVLWVVTAIVAVTCGKRLLRSERLGSFG